MSFHMYIDILSGELVGRFHRKAAIRPGPALHDDRLRNDRDEPLHLVEHPDNASRNNRCVVCLEKHCRAKLHNPQSAYRDLPKQRKTVFNCSVCNVFLCVGSGDSNCFKAYHTKVQYWR